VEGERVLESLAIIGLGHDSETVGLLLAERAIDGPGVGLILDLNTSYAPLVSDRLFAEISTKVQNNLNLLATLFTGTRES
jgi:hypothetical protein